jgi:5-methylcytosine-specific restriction endonuclease McrA
MRLRLRRLLLLAAATDAQAECVDGAWRTRCLHCRSRLVLSAGGEPLGPVTLEHVVPRAWFERAAAAGLVARVGTPDDPRNLALACGRCNHDKGKGPDERGPGDARAHAVVEALLERRLARWREPQPVDRARGPAGVLARSGR